MWIVAFCGSGLLGNNRTLITTETDSPEGVIMQKVLFSLPERIWSPGCGPAFLPNSAARSLRTCWRRGSRREQALYQCALEVEADEALKLEMKD
jgi:hypothetical protein